MVLDASLLNTQYYKVRIKGKVEQSREGVAPSPTPWCSSYRKESLRVTLDYGRQLYLLTKLYMDNPESILANETLKILSILRCKHQFILDRRPDLAINNSFLIVDLSDLADDRDKIKENEKTDKY